MRPRDAEHDDLFAPTPRSPWADEHHWDPWLNDD